MREHRVLCLLMGGQACVFYGAAEFSRDTDLAVLAEDGNLTRLQAALDELQAELIAVPDFDPAHLHKGHAIHFRCHHPEATGMRVDVMSKMRGVDPFPDLWERRTTLETQDGTVCDLLSLPDLVLAKKTQPAYNIPAASTPKATPAISPPAPASSSRNSLPATSREQHAPCFLKITMSLKRAKA